MLTGSAQWKQLAAHYQDVEHIHMRDLFKEDPKRFANYSITTAGITLDYSKNKLTEQSLPLLIELAKSVELEQRRSDMFNGLPINLTEKRPVLHTALRNFSNKPVLVNGQDVMPDIRAALAKVKNFVNNISSGEVKGYTGKAFTDVFSISIGGSFLGPKIMSEALKPYQQKQLKVHLIAKLSVLFKTSLKTWPAS